MQVILLEKVQNLGVLGDTVNVKPGYARNFLVPQGKAVFASRDNVEKFKARRADLERIEQEKLATAEKRKAALQAVNVVIRSRAGDEGKLYGSLGTQDIAQAFSAEGVEVLKREVRLPTGPIRQIGEHAMTLQLHSDVAVEVSVQVEAER